MIPVDAVFSPVKQVSYKVENSRVGQVTDFDKLTLNIETDGSMTPKMQLRTRHEYCRTSFSYL